MLIHTISRRYLSPALQSGQFNREELNMHNLRETFVFPAKNKKNSRLKNVLLVLFFACLLGLPAKADYGSGTGEPNDHYLIYTAEQMNEISAKVQKAL